MRTTTLLLLFGFACLASCATFPTAEMRNMPLEGLVRMRCSLNEADETLFFFNGSVMAYTPTYSKQIFKTIGINIARCFKWADGSYWLASREALWYVDPVTDKILYSWNNLVDGETVDVVHVDNDPVIQKFNVSTPFYPVQVLGAHTLLPLDIPLTYPNGLSYDPRMKPYSPQALYQAGEFFKFISPSAEVFSSLPTVSESLVSWTRVGPWLPWMKHGNMTGYLVYSSHGAKIPDWTYLPQSIKDDLDRIPWYRHAPVCIPNTASVTSWSFFQNNFNLYLNGATFPKAPQVQYPCLDYPKGAPPPCSASITATYRNDGSQSYDTVLKNTGTQKVTSLSFSLGVDPSNMNGQPWNAQNLGGGVYSPTIYWPGYLAVGATQNGPGFNLWDHSASTIPVTVTSVTCSN